MKLRLIAAALVLASLGAALTACGQKGELYLPEHSAPTHSQH